MVSSRWRYCLRRSTEISANQKSLVQNHSHTIKHSDKLACSESVCRKNLNNYSPPTVNLLSQSKYIFPRLYLIIQKPLTQHIITWLAYRHLCQYSCLNNKARSRLRASHNEATHSLRFYSLFTIMAHKHLLDSAPA